VAAPCTCKPISRMIPSSVTQELAAIRMLFNWMVTGQVVPTNPAAAVRGPTHVVKTYEEIIGLGIRGMSR